MGSKNESIENALIAKSGNLQHIMEDSAARLQCLLEFSNSYYWEQDTEHRFTLIQQGNQAKSIKAMRALPHFIGKTSWELGGTPVSGDGSWDEYKALRAARQEFRDFVVWRIDERGDERFISISGQPVFDEKEQFKGYRGVSREVTYEKLNERYAETVELVAIGVSHVDASGKFIHVNQQLCKMLGYTREELLNLTIKKISHPDDEKVTDEIRAQLRSGEISSFKMEKRYLRKDKTPIWVGLTIAVSRGPNNEALYDVSVIEDISARREAEERVQYLATHDGMTSLPNRVLFHQLLKHAIESAERYKRKFAVLFIDLDRFKQINDTLGHEAGDILLIEMSKRFKGCLRTSDVVARLGGDEFVVLVQEISDPSQVAVVARNILSVAMKPLEIMDQECRVTASIGICMYPEEAQDEQTLMQNADMAMYLAKEEGKNNFQFYSKDIKSLSIEKLALESNLRQAMDRDEFEVHYQAKVNVKSGSINGVEALLRWNSLALGPVSPAQFIPLTEEMGLIVPLGRWVLKTACEQNRAWQDKGLPNVCISVNLSPRQFQDAELIPYIKEVLEETGIEPQYLELEITESMVMHNTETALVKLNELKEMGVSIAIDDFGTGYSSLSQLKHFPVDTLKIDRSFIRELPTDMEDMAITEAIIAMGKMLGLTVVAEGVETAEQQTFLSEHACDEIQGFHFSKPVSPEDFEKLLAEYQPTPRK
ncbi:EAL domain-containing protein [Gammaproteobacteria bacterium]|nr:EAL domain-containing protein [Gammaproteobacteria bacterium]